MTGVAANSRVGVALRRRALAVVLAGLPVVAAAVLVANPYFAPGTQLAEILKHWPYNVPQIGAAIAVCGILIAAAGVLSGRALGAGMWVRFGAVLVGFCALGWFGNKKGGLCTAHLCDGRIGHVANWWIYWALVAASIIWTAGGLKVAEQIKRR